jgi:hypothetical protein
MDWYPKPRAKADDKAVAEIRGESWSAISVVNKADQIGEPVPKSRGDRYGWSRAIARATSSAARSAL